MNDALHARIDHDFTNQAPKDASVVERFEALREPAKAFGHEIVDRCPQSRELSLALTHLEQALMYAEAAIARHQDTDEG